MPWGGGGEDSRRKNIKWAKKNLKRKKTSGKKGLVDCSIFFFFTLLL